MTLSSIMFSEKKIYSSKIGVPIWHVMLAFMQENMSFS